MNDRLNDMPERTALNVNPLDYPSIKCDECGSEYYKQVVLFKRIPGVVTGNGAEPTILPIPIYICEKCGRLMEEYRKDFEKNSADSSDNSNNSNIII